MEEKHIREVNRILERIRISERKYGEIILVVKNGEVKFVDFRGSAELLADAPDKTLTNTP